MARPCCSASTTWRWSWTSPSASSCSITGRRSPRGLRRPSAGTRRSSRRTLAVDGALLELREVVAGYEEVEVLRGVSLAVRAGEIVCIIGANGAGKSTLLRTVFGMVPPRAGAISFAGQDIALRSSLAVLKPGSGYRPQEPSQFHALHVQEDLQIGAYL